MGPCRKQRWIGKAKAAAAAVLLVLVVLACGGSKSGQMSSDASYDKARQLFEKHKWEKSALEFESFIFGHPGAASVDSAQYFLAMCRFEQKDYIIAADEFLRFRRRYPTSDLVDETDFLRCKALIKISPENPSLDQERTQIAIIELNLFKDRHPLSPHIVAADSLLGVSFHRLSQRDFRAGKLYHRLGRHDAARIYFQEVLDNYPESPLVTECLYYIADGYRKLDSLDQAIEYYEKLVYLFPDHELTEKASKRVIQLHHRREEIEELQSSP
jgi:outer membrane protein assembly factor BamD